MLSSNTIENTLFCIFIKILDLHGHGNKTPTLGYNSIIVCIYKNETPLPSFSYFL